MLKRKSRQQKPTPDDRFSKQSFKKKNHLKHVKGLK